MGHFLHRAGPWASTLILHNWPVLAYLACMLAAALLSYLRPTRPRLLCLYGFATLALAFEYQKHGLGVALGTAGYLFEENPEARYLGQLLLGELMSPALHLAGLGLLILSALLVKRRNAAGKAASRVGHGEEDRP